MQQENFAPDYDVFTGKPTTPITHFGEVHSGEMFEPARAKYCGDDPTNMLCPLILFYDKTYVDLHSSLACSAVIMWPTFFKQECRNKLKFARVLGYMFQISHLARVGHLFKHQLKKFKMNITVSSIYLIKYPKFTMMVE